MTEPANKIISVLIAHEHAVVGEGLRMLIDSNPRFQVVGVATNQSEALLMAKAKKPAVILLDLDFDNEEGFPPLTQLSQVAKRSRVLMLASERRSEECRKAVKLGAMGIVFNKDGPALLNKAIQKVHQGEVWVDRSMMGILLNEITNGHDLDSDEAKIASLTERERMVISLVGQGLKNKEISKRLFVGETTVSHRLSSVFSKLGVSDRLELVIYAFRNGLADIPKRTNPLRTTIRA